MDKIKFQGLYTKDQMLVVLRSMKVYDPLPRGNSKKTIYFTCENGDECTVSVSSHKSTYGKTLYEYVIKVPSENDG